MSRFPLTAPLTGAGGIKHALAGQDNHGVSVLRHALPRIQRLAAHVGAPDRDGDDDDHHRSGDVVSLLDALSGHTDALATSDDFYNRKAILVVGADMARLKTISGTGIAWVDEASASSNKFGADPESSRSHPRPSPLWL